MTSFMNEPINIFVCFRYDRRCGIKYDVVYDSVNEKACTRTYEEKCDGKNLIYFGIFRVCRNILCSITKPRIYWNLLDFDIFNVPLESPSSMAKPASRRGNPFFSLIGSFIN